MQTKNEKLFYELLDKTNNTGLFRCPCCMNLFFELEDKNGKKFKVEYDEESDEINVNGN